MDVLAYCVIVLLPWLVGWLLVRRLLSTRAVQHPALPAGFGYFIGHYLVALLVFVTGRIGDMVEPGAVVIALITVALLSLYGQVRGRAGGAVLFSPSKTPPINSPFNPGADRNAWILLALLLFYVVLRYTVLLADYSARPLFAWDAFKYWTLQAQSWFQLGTIGYWAWDDGSGGFALLPQPFYPASAAHPLTVSLMSLWSMLVSGQAYGPTVNVQWSLVPVAMALLVYGSLRGQRCNVPLSVLGAYLILSTPLLNVHAMLHGYADIWLAGCLLCAAVALLHYWQQSSYRWLVLLILSVLMALLTKTSAWLFLLAALAALCSWYLAKHLRTVTLTTSGVIVAVLVFVLFRGIDVQIPVLGALYVDWPHFQVRNYEFTLAVYNTLPIFLTSWVTSANWHLGMLAYLAGIGIFVLRRRRWPDVAVSKVVVISIALMLVPVLAATFSDRYYRFFATFTTTNRMFLAVYPVCIYVFMLILAALRDKAPEHQIQSTKG